MDRSEQKTKRITNIKGGISGYVWAPDGKRLAIEYYKEIPLKKDVNGKNIPEPWVIDRVIFKSDSGDGYLHNRLKSKRIYLYDLQTKSFKPLTKGGEFKEFSPTWSPDGSRIAFVTNRDANHEHTDYGDIYVVKSKIGSMPKRLTDFKGDDYKPRMESRRKIYRLYTR